jgi:hypothetical protein
MVYCLNDNPTVTTDEMIALLAKTLGYTHVALGKTQQIKDNTEQKQTSQLIDWLESTRNVVDEVLRRLGVGV